MQPFIYRYVMLTSCKLQPPCSQCYSLKGRACCVLMLMIIKSMKMKMTKICCNLAVQVLTVCVRKEERDRWCVCVNVVLRRELKGHLQMSHTDNHYPCIYNALSTYCQEDTHTRTRTHTDSPLYLTEPNYRHLSLSDETKNCSIFRLMESDVSLSFSSSSFSPLSICCRLFAAPQRTVPRPPPTPLSHV